MIMLLVVTVAGADSISAQGSRRSVRKVEKGMAGSKRKEGKSARAAAKAMKAQEKQEARRRKEQEKALDENRKRHYSIQTADVQTRMKENENDIKLRDKERKKKARQDARKPGSAKKKYRRK